MFHRFPTSILLAIILCIFAVQLAAVYRHLYFFFWWLDIPMHILGGLWIALAGLTVYFSSSHFERDFPPIFVFAFGVAITLVIGLGWEIYEFAIDHAVGDLDISLADTLKDLSDDLAGALLGAFIFIRGGYNIMHEK